MENRIVVDTSVAIKWFVDEGGSDVAFGLLQQYKDNEISLLAPRILHLELVNGLYYSYHWDRNSLIEMLRQLDIIPLEDLEYEVLKGAIAIQQTYDIAIYDACFISFARQNKATLVTEDRKHHRKEIYNRIQYLT